MCAVNSTATADSSGWSGLWRQSGTTSRAANPSNSRPPSANLEQQSTTSNAYGSFFFNKSSNNNNNSNNNAAVAHSQSAKTPSPPADGILNRGASQSMSAAGEVRAPPGAISAALLGIAASPTNGSAAGYSDNDFIYNLMDDYAALLCCAFIHLDIIQSLCHLGTYGESGLASKSRTLLVDIMTIVSNLFPEEKCAELLEMPVLVEYASTLSNSHSHVTRSMRASDILSALAESFSNFSGRALAIPGNKADAQSGRTNPTSNPITSTSSTGNSSSSSAASSTSGSTIGAVSIELKHSCRPRVDGLLLSCKGASASTDLMYDLRFAITNAIDRTEFGRQMDKSLVIGKEGKEPFKWDWAMIDDMLEYCFKNPERLSDALKTKWVKRVSGFYRCTVDEKAYFANCEWGVGNMQYMECACNMYHVLVGKS